jgi:hypothetical protein
MPFAPDVVCRHLLLQVTFQGLSAHQRAVLHQFAEQCGLGHGSSGEGEQRCISIRATHNGVPQVGELAATCYNHQQLHWYQLFTYCGVCNVTCGMPCVSCAVMCCCDSLYAVAARSCIVLAMPAFMLLLVVVV